MYVYVLHSAKLGRFYAGISTFRDKRVRQHRKGQSLWTSRADDWREIWVTEAANIAEARETERAIKDRGISRFLQDRGVAAP
jgi:putative endonuclease